MLCSRLVLIRPKGLDVDDSEGVIIVGVLERADVVGGGGREGMANGLETLTEDDTAATAIDTRDWGTKNIRRDSWRRSITHCE